MDPLTRSLFVLSTLACIATQGAVEAPRTLRVAVDNAYAPYSFVSDEGKLQGILVDLWQAWEGKTGTRVRIQALDWDEALRRMRAGEFDVIDCIVATAERLDDFEFTPPYATVTASIYFRGGISGITDLASLKGFPVAVKTGDQHVDKLKANGVTNLILYRNNDAILQAAKEHTVNVFLVDDPSALYLLHRMGLEDDFRHSSPIFRDDLRRAVRKGDAATLRRVADGFAALAPRELRQIDERWFGRTINTYGQFLIYAVYAAMASIALIGGLLGWNRALRKGIAQRTRALGESELHFRQIAENIREVFWMTTPAMEELLYVSSAYESVWGRSLESLRRRPRSFMDAIHDDDREAVIGIIEGRREQGFEVEYRIVRPDGSLRWIRDRAIPLKDESGKVYRIVGIAEDITERKRAQEEALQTARKIQALSELREDYLRVVIDTIPTMAWSLAPDGAVDFVNQRWLEYTGLSFEEAIEASTGIVHPEDVSRVVEKWLGDKAAGRAGEDEMRLRRADGEYRWFLVRTVPLRDGEGNIVKWYGASTDITEHKQAADALRQSAAQLQALSRSLVNVQEAERRQLSRELHDRVGQNLTALKINLGILRPALAARGNDEVLARVDDSATLLESTMDVIENVMSELRPPMLDDHGLAAALDWHARDFSRRTGIEVAVHGSKPVSRPPPEVEIALYRIAQEALNNVAKHAGARHVEVTLDHRGSECTLSIEDDGIGLPGAEDHAGAPIPGLGMVTMRERSQAVGGRFEVLALPGQGTRLRVRVPY